MSDDGDDGRYTINPTGLKRCCLETLIRMMIHTHAELNNKPPPKEGEKRYCQVCNDEYPMIFHNGTWQHYLQK